LKNIIPNKEIRTNSDIKNIVVYHTENINFLEGKNYNKEFSVYDRFGVPYDIIINVDGKVDLSPQWIYALEYTQYKKNVSYTNIIPTTLHHYAQVGKTLEEKREMCHVAIMGDFNQSLPSPFQISSLIKVLEVLCRSFNLCPINSILYYSELYVVTSPGILFPDKQKIIDELMLRKRIVSICTGILLPNIAVYRNDVFIEINSIEDLGESEGDVTVTYIIKNEGDGNLVLSTIQILNKINCNVTTLVQPSGIIFPNDFTTLQLQISPILSANYSFSITINNNDSNREPYNWGVEGYDNPTLSLEPEIWFKDTTLEQDPVSKIITWTDVEYGFILKNMQYDDNIDKIQINGRNYLSVHGQVTLIDEMVRCINPDYFILKRSNPPFGEGIDNNTWFFTLAGEYVNGGTNIWAWALKGSYNTSFGGGNVAIGMFELLNLFNLYFLAHENNGSSTTESRRNTSYPVYDTGKIFVVALRWDNSDSPKLKLYGNGETRTGGLDTFSPFRSATNIGTPLYEINIPFSWNNAIATHPTFKMGEWFRIGHACNLDELNEGLFYLHKLNNLPYDFIPITTL